MLCVYGCFQTAFEELKPFPRRRDIAAKQVVYVNALKEKFKKREALRKAFSDKDRKVHWILYIYPFRSTVPNRCASPSSNKALYLLKDKFKQIPDETSKNHQETVKFKQYSIFFLLAAAHAEIATSL